MSEGFIINETFWGLIVSGIYAGGLLAAFLVGLFRVCMKKKPLYFRLIVYAVGGFALEGIGFFVNSICTGSADYIDVSVISRFAYYVFLISASVGALDGLLDDKSMNNKKARFLALIAPLLLGVCVAVYYVLFSGYLGSLDTVIGCLLGAFNMVSVYYALKHLLLPPDEIGFLKATRPINIMILVEAGVETVSDYLGILFPEMINALAFVYVAIFFMLIYFVLKGVKKWETLV